MQCGAAAAGVRRGAQGRTQLAVCVCLGTLRLSGAARDVTRVGAVWVRWLGLAAGQPASPRDPAPIANCAPVLPLPAVALAALAAWVAVPSGPPALVVGIAPRTRLSWVFLGIG